MLQEIGSLELILEFQNSIRAEFRFELLDPPRGEHGDEKRGGALDSSVDDPTQSCRLRSWLLRNVLRRSIANKLNFEEISGGAEKF